MVEQSFDYFLGCAYGGLGLGLSLMISLGMTPWAFQKLGIWQGNWPAQDGTLGVQFFSLFCTSYLSPLL